MSFFVELTPAAFGDLERLDAWLTVRDPNAAIRVSDLLEEAIGSLVDYPLRGRQIDPSLRELTVRFGRDGYIIRYEVSGDQVMVTRIWHGLENR